MTGGMIPIVPAGMRARLMGGAATSILSRAAPVALARPAAPRSGAKLDDLRAETDAIEGQARR